MIFESWSQLKQRRNTPKSLGSWRRANGLNFGEKQGHVGGLDFVQDVIQDCEQEKMDALMQTSSSSFGWNLFQLQFFFSNFFPIFFPMEVCEAKPSRPSSPYGPWVTWHVWNPLKPCMKCTSQWKTKGRWKAWQWTSWTLGASPLPKLHTYRYVNEPFPKHG